MKETLEKIWYSQSKWLFILWPLQLPFLLLVNLKRWLYLKGLVKSQTASKATIVVGNISVGGTGKTPLINRLVCLLARENLKVGLVSRGYRSLITDFPHQVSAKDSAHEVGDEAFMQYKSLNVPIVIDPVRARAVKHLVDKNDIDVVISDDGLQHYQMARDLEIVLIDGSRQLGNRLVLPFGPLRESTERLNSVDFVLQNGCQDTIYTLDKVELKATFFVNLKTGKKSELTTFKNQSANAVAGIGNTERFFDTLQNFCNVETTKSFPDHHQYCANDFSDYGEQTVIMTEKDAVKCFEFAKPNWYCLVVEMQIPQELQNRLVDKVKKVISSK